MIKIYSKGGNIMAKLLENNTLNELQTQVFNEAMTYVATVDEQGNPQLAPKGSLKVLDDKHLIFIEYSYGHTYENIKANGKVAASAWGLESKKAFRVEGKATLQKDTDFANEYLAGTGRENDVVTIIEIERIYALN